MSGNPNSECPMQVCPVGQAACGAASGHRSLDGAGVHMPTHRRKEEGAGARCARPLTSNNQLQRCSANQAEVERLATALAKLALAGYSLLQLQDGSFRVGRWNFSKALADRSAVEQFLQKVSP